MGEREGGQGRIFEGEKDGLRKGVEDGVDGEGDGIGLTDDGREVRSGMFFFSFFFLFL